METGDRKTIKRNKEVKQEKGLLHTDHDDVPWTKGSD